MIVPSTSKETGTLDELIRSSKRRCSVLDDHDDSNDVSVTKR